ncbi:MAG: isopenicillin N synthase family oxygenase [Actinobacteria bacterium]|nr:isopenicillin N synthase family oxygenase [Actinomycetota bacterium]
MTEMPVIDVSALRADPDVTGGAARATAAAIDGACRASGFFLVTGHGIDPERYRRLDAEARSFFALPTAAKETVAMARGGRAWRGWFPEGGELTSGRADRKEGLYLGEDLGPDDPRVRAGLPLHGPNLLPDDLLPALRGAVDDWIDAMTGLGHLLVRAIGVGLGLTPSWFDEHLTAEPTVLLRLFRYPPGDGDEDWGVGEHTDYGLVTILAHDGRPGLEVRTADGWIPVPSVDGSFVVNLGDMLDRMTGGRYRSTPHRVRSTTAADGGRDDRISIPFFFDPSWDAEVAALPLTDPAPDDDRASRWDGASVHEWQGTYGDYLTAKVAKVFPALGADVLDGGGSPTPDLP